MSSDTAHPNCDDLFRFEGLTLDLRLGRLSGPSGDVPLRPKVFALLAYLARHAGRVLPKAELMDAVWPDVTVTEESLSQCVHALRDALGKSGPSLVRTVSRRGYVFDLPTSSRPHAVAAPRPNSVETAIPAMREGCMAVMPFDMEPSVPLQDRLWFDGVVNDVISQLARLRSFDVIARGSTFALRHMADDPVRAGQMLDVAYVLAGSVGPKGNGFCLRADLVRVDTGAIVWTDDIFVGLGRILDLVGALTDKIIGAVLSGIAIFERNRARLMPDQSLTAWQAYHRGLDAGGIYSEQSLTKARACFALATELDPGFVRAFAALSECQETLSRALFCQDQKAEADASLRSAEHAMHLDESSPSAQFAYAQVRLARGEHEVALFHARQSVRLSPSFADGFEEVGFIEAHQGDAAIALQHLARAELLSPFSKTLDAIHITRAVAHVQLNNLEDAAHWATSAVNRLDSYPQMQATGAMVLAASGRMEEARRIVATLHQEKAAYDPARLFAPPYSLHGPAREALQRSAATIGL